MRLREGKFQGETPGSHDFLPEALARPLGGQVQPQLSMVVLKCRAADSDWRSQDRVVDRRELHREGAPEMSPGVPIGHSLKTKLRI